MPLYAQVICEMATAAMALSVYKRFQMFPCIIQNNPLFFSRKPDPKVSTQTKVITAYLDSSEVSSFDNKLAMVVHYPFRHICWQMLLAKCPAASTPDCMCLTWH